MTHSIDILGNQAADVCTIDDCCYEDCCYDDCCDTCDDCGSYVRQLTNNNQTLSSWGCCEYEAFNMPFSDFEAKLCEIYEADINNPECRIVIQMFPHMSTSHMKNARVWRIPSSSYIYWWLDFFMITEDPSGPFPNAKPKDNGTYNLEDVLMDVWVNPYFPKNTNNFEIIALDCQMYSFFNLDYYYEYSIDVDFKLKYSIAVDYGAYSDRIRAVWGLMDFKGGW